MTTTNLQTGTRVDEIHENVYRIHTPISEAPGGFSFNQYLVLDDEPLLFHTGPRALAPVVLQAIAHVMPLEKLRFISFGHVEADECGGLNALLAAAPRAEPVCGHIGALVSVADLADRPPRALQDGDSISLGSRALTWIAAPHLPHGWDNGFLFDAGAKILFAGDLFTQPGASHPPLTEGDILGPSEGFRAAMDYFAHGKNTAVQIERLAALAPTTLACMHGAAWRGDGAALLRGLGTALSS